MLAKVRIEEALMLEVKETRCESFVRSRREEVEKRSLLPVNEHFRPTCNAEMAKLSHRVKGWFSKEGKSIAACIVSVSALIGCGPGGKPSQKNSSTRQKTYKSLAEREYDESAPMTLAGEVTEADLGEGFVPPYGEETGEESFAFAKPVKSEEDDAHLFRVSRLAETGKSSSTKKPSYLQKYEGKTDEEITNLVRKTMRELVTAGDIRYINEKTCPELKSAPHPFKLMHHYYPGIQAFTDYKVDSKTKNPIELFGRLKLADRGTGDLYVKYARQTLVAPSKHIQIQDWKLVHYFNQPTVNISRDNGDGDHSTQLVGIRYKNNDSIMMASRYRYGRSVRYDELRTRDGELVYNEAGWQIADLWDVKVLGAWAAEQDSEKFLNAEPSQFSSQFIRHEFKTVFKREILEDEEWQSFIRSAAIGTAVALKCGSTVYAHSGGAVIAAFVLRYLAEIKGLNWADWPRWRNEEGEYGFRLVSLEGVMSEEVAAHLQKLPVFNGNLTVTNYVTTTPEGSKTFREVIAPEIEALGHKPLITGYSKNPFPDKYSLTQLFLKKQLDHGAIGFYILKYGKLPAITY